jgi:hypothetical protein
MIPRLPFASTSRAFSAASRFYWLSHSLLSEWLGVKKLTLICGTLCTNNYHILLQSQLLWLLVDICLVRVNCKESKHCTLHGPAHYMYWGNYWFVVGKVRLSSLDREAVIPIAILGCFPQFLQRSDRILL